MMTGFEANGRSYKSHCINVKGGPEAAFYVSRARLQRWMFLP